MRAWRAGKEQGRKLLAAAGHPTLGYVPSGQAGSRAGLWGPRRTPLPCLPSQQVAEGQNTSTEQKEHGRGGSTGPGVEVREGVVCLDLAWRKGGISDEAALPGGAVKPSSRPSPPPQDLYIQLSELS